MSSLDSAETLPAALWPQEAAPRQGDARPRLDLRRCVRGHGLVLAALSLWTLIPLALQVSYLIRHGGAFDGIQAMEAPDYFQYLWWVREAGTHVLISDPYQLVGPSQAVFFQPMFVLSGLLWRAGLSLTAAYLLPGHRSASC